MFDVILRSEARVPARAAFYACRGGSDEESLLLFSACAIRVLHNRAGIERVVRSPLPAAPVAPNVRRHRQDGIPPYVCMRCSAFFRPPPASDRPPNLFSPQFTFSPHLSFFIKPFH